MGVGVAERAPAPGWVQSSNADSHAANLEGRFVGGAETCERLSGGDCLASIGGSVRANGARARVHGSHGEGEERHEGSDNGENLQKRGTNKKVAKKLTIICWSFSSANLYLRE